MAVIPRSRRHRNPTGSMTLLEHLGELRNRLIISVLAVGIGAIVGWFLYAPVFNFLTDPYCNFIQHYPQLGVKHGHCNGGFMFTTVIAPFMLKIKLATYIGFAIALPVTLYQIWRFITPGLNPNERRYAVPFVVASVLLFVMGAVFAMLTLPKALAFLLGFAGTSRFTLLLTADKYVSFVLLLISVFGLSFEFPVVLVALVAAGVLSSEKLRRWRRYAVFGIAVFAAVITPSQDWFTMSAMMVPLLVFYELSILVSRFVLKK